MAGSIEGSAVDWALPPLPLEEWEDSKETLHRYTQVIGKIRLRYTPSAPSGPPHSGVQKL